MGHSSLSPRKFLILKGLFNLLRDYINSTHYKRLLMNSLFILFTQMSQFTQCSLPPIVIDVDILYSEHELCS